MTTPGQLAHQARLIQTAATKKNRKPSGNLTNSEHQWGVVAKVNSGPTPTVDLYLGGSQNNKPGNVTPSVKFQPWYVPTVGDVVLVYRGAGRNRSSRVVLGKLNGAASPTPLPLGSLNSAGQWVVGPYALWGSVGIPPQSMGGDGDWCFREDLPEIFNKQDGEWVEVLGQDQGVAQLIAGQGIYLDPLVGEGVVTVSAQLTGEGSPENVVAAPPGSQYEDSDTGALYLKVAGISGTGWAVMCGDAVDLSSPIPTAGLYVSGDPAEDVTLAGPNVEILGSNGLVLAEMGSDGIILQTGAKQVHVFVNASNPNGVVSAIAAGDICVDTGTPGFWQASASGNASWGPLGGGMQTLPFNYSVSGLLVPPSGAYAYLPPFFWPVPTHQTVALLGVQSMIRSGSFVDFDVYQNGSSIGSATATTTPSFGAITATVADGDYFAPVITSVAAGADGLSISFYFAVTG